MGCRLRGSTYRRDRTGFRKRSAKTFLSQRSSFSHSSVQSFFLCARLNVFSSRTIAERRFRPQFLFLRGPTMACSHTAQLLPSTEQSLQRRSYILCSQKRRECPKHTCLSLQTHTLFIATKLTSIYPGAPRVEKDSSR